LVASRYVAHAYAGAADVNADGARRERAVEIEIGAIVARGEYEVRLRLSVREELRDVCPFVDAARANLDHTMPEQDLRSRAW